MAQGSEGTKAIALGLCREFEDKFLQHIAGGEVSDSNDTLLDYIIFIYSFSCEVFMSSINFPVCTILVLS